MSVDSRSDPLEERARISIGRMLASQRRLAGITGSELAERTGMSQSKISRIENGRAPVTRNELNRLAEALELPPEVIQGLLDAAESPQGLAADVSSPPLDLAQRQLQVRQGESTTQELRVFTQVSIAGLLQTSEYARAVLMRFYRLLLSEGSEPEEPTILDSVATRLSRQRILADSDRSFTFIMPESVLNNRYCPATQMLAQLQRIRDVAKQHDNVTVAIVPLGVDQPPGSPNMDIHDDSYVLIDLPHSGIVLTDPTEVAIYRRLFDRIEESATTDIEPILDKYIDLYYEQARPRRQ